MASLEYKRKLSRKAHYYRNVHNCKLCPYITKSILWMKNHLNLHRYPSKQFNCLTSTLEAYSCPHCEFTADVVTLLNRHIEFHSTSTVPHTEYSTTSYICRKCSFETDSVLFWLKHFKDRCRKSQITGTVAKPINKEIPEEVTWLESDDCALKFKTNNDLQLHKTEQHVNQGSNSLTLVVFYVPTNEESGIKPQNEVQWPKSDLCSFRTENENSLKIHTNALPASDSMVEWLKCVNCSYKTRVKDELEEHICLYTPSGAITWHYCDKCPFKTEFKIDLEDHKLKQHSDKILAWHKCQNDNCNFKAETKTDLQSHVLLVHINSIKCFKCCFCRYKSKSESLFAKHMEFRHLMLKCNQCPYQTRGMFFLRKHQRTYHMVTTEGEWLMQSDQCEFKTKDKDSLKNHTHVIQQEVRQTEKITSFKCGQCSLIFETNRLLDDHRNLKHAAARNVELFTYNQCSYQTEYTKYLRDHIVK